MYPPCAAMHVILTNVQLSWPEVIQMSARMTATTANGCARNSSMDCSDWAACVWLCVEYVCERGENFKEKWRIEDRGTKAGCKFGGV